MRPSVIGCLGTIVVTYLFVGLVSLYLGVASGAVAVITLVLFGLGVGVNVIVRAFLGSLLATQNSESMMLGRVTLFTVFLTPLLLLLLALPFTFGASSINTIQPIILWTATFLIALPSYYWTNFASEIPWVHWKLNFPFPTEKAMRREQKKMMDWLSRLLLLGTKGIAEDQPKGSLILGKGIQGGNLIAPRREVVLNPGARATHTIVIGQPGTGKSRALESWIMQDIKSGQGVGVIDPHGQLFDHILSRVAQLAEEDPSLAERVVIIDPLDKNYTVGFNPLEAIQGISSERLALFLTDVAIKIWSIDTSETPRMTQLLTYTFLALAELGLRIADFPRFLQDADWREELLARVTHPEVVSYFRFQFPKSTGGIQQWIAPALSRVGKLLLDNDLRLIFSAGSTINFRAMLDDGLILLVNLSKGHLTEGSSELLGAFIVAHLQKAALARLEDGVRPFYLYLDEFQNYTTDNIKDILSETRKFGLPLVLAHQYLSQLSPTILNAVKNTTGTIASFRVGHDDAEWLSKELFPPGSVEVAPTDLKFKRIGRFSLFPFPQEESESLNHEERAALLTQLDNREFWVKRRGSYAPSMQRTFEMPVLKSEALFKARVQLRDISGKRYGRLKEQVKAESEHERQQLISRFISKSGIITDYEEK